VHRAPGGKALASLVEVAVYEPACAFSLRVVEGTPIHADLSFAPAGAGRAFSLRAFGSLGGVMRVAEPLLARGLRKQFAAACARLKAELESS
jgi:hypothetical protein